MVHEKQKGVSYCVLWRDGEGRVSSTIRLAVGEVVHVFLRIFEFFLLSDGLGGNNFCKTLQAWSLEP
jgi:hypothetical protein